MPHYFINSFAGPAMKQSTMAVQEGLGGVDVNLTVKYFDVTNPE
jgi:hypothetical protein